MSRDHATHQRWTLAVVCVSTALLLLNVAAPQVALAAIADSLDASFADLQWVLSGYALALAVFLLSAGSLADRFGRRRLFLIGLAMFSVASALCALAPGAGTLIAARLVQGLGASVVFPSSLAILAEAFQGADRRRAIGAWGATIGLAFAAGPLGGGALVDAFCWRTTVVGCLVLCLVALCAFVAIERATARPMLDLRLFRNRTFTGATVIVALLAGGALRAFGYVT